MAQPQMQCKTCREWIKVDEYQINVPTHGVTRGLKARCAGSGRTPQSTKGFKRPPPSIEGQKK